jgi:HAMP domain-containing protein
MENAAAMPADAGGVEIPADAPSYTPPISTAGMEQPQQEAPEIAVKEDKPSNPLDKAIAAAEVKAREKLEAKEALEKAPKVEPTQKVDAKAEQPKPETKEPAPRAEDGKFAAKNPQPIVEPKPTQYKDAPARFDDAAKSEWANAPESVKGAVTRAVKEMEDGLTKYKANHERYEQFKEYDETAKANGRDLKQSIASVLEFEKTLKANPIAAIDYALREVGPRDSQGRPISLNDIVAHVSGQSTDQRLTEAQSTIQELRTQLQQMEYAKKVPDMVAEFASTHDRFEELTGVIVPLLKAGHELETAYELAAALKPASSAEPEPKPLIPAPTTEALAQTQSRPANPAGQKSISGAPSAGSDPAARKKGGKLESIDNSLDRVFARMGL